MSGKFFHRYYLWFFRRKDWNLLTRVPTNRTIWVNPGCPDPTNCEIEREIYENDQYGYLMERDVIGRVVA